MPHDGATLHDDVRTRAARPSSSVPGRQAAPAPSAHALHRGEGRLLRSPPRAGRTGPAPGPGPCALEERALGAPVRRARARPRAGSGQRHREGGGAVGGRRDVLRRGRHHRDAPLGQRQRRHAAACARLPAHGRGPRAAGQDDGGAGRRGRRRRRARAGHGVRLRGRGGVGPLGHAGGGRRHHAGLGRDDAAQPAGGPPGRRRGSTSWARCTRLVGPRSSGCGTGSWPTTRWTRRSTPSSTCCSRRTSRPSAS